MSFLSAQIARHPLRTVGTIMSVAWTLSSWGGISLSLAFGAVLVLVLVFFIIWKKVGELTSETSALSSTVHDLSKKVVNLENTLKPLAKDNRVE